MEDLKACLGVFAGYKSTHLRREFFIHEVTDQAHSKVPRADRYSHDLHALICHCQSCSSEDSYLILRE